MKRLSKRQKQASQRAKTVETLIRQVYTSLESHLEWTHRPIRNRALDGSASFQKKCVSEYAGIILLLTRLY